MSRRPALLALAVALLLAACGGGGGGGGPTAPPPPSSGISFTPAGSSAGPAVALVAQSTTGGALVLRLEARGFTDVYGLYFDLSYPNAVLSFQGATEGTFLSTGGATAFEIAEEAGNLIVGLSRLGATPGVSGDGTLLTLRFSGSGTGSGALSFSRNQGIASDGDPVALDWVGGNVTVSQ